MSEPGERSCPVRLVDAKTPQRTSNQRRRPWVLWSISALLVTFLGALIFLFSADLGFIKPRLERSLSASLQRDFRIDGELRLELGVESYLSATGVVLADADRTTDTPMLTIGQLEIRLRPLSLLRRTLVIERLAASDIGLRLARDADGIGNWPYADRKPTAPADDQDHGQAWRIVLKDIEVRALSTVLVSALRAQPLNVEIRSFRQLLLDDDRLDYSLVGASGGREISAAGNVSTWSNLLEGENVGFDLQADLDTLHLTASGNIDRLGRPSRPEVRIEAYGPDVRDFAALLGLADAGEGDIRVAARLVPQAGGPLELDAVGNLGAATFRAHGKASDLGSLGDVDLAAAASGPDLGRLLAYFGLQTTLNAPFELELDTARRDRQIVIQRADARLGDTKLSLTANIPDFSDLHDARFEFTFGGPDFAAFRRLTGLPGASEGAFSVESSLRLDVNGHPVVSLVASLPVGTVRGNAEIGAGPDFEGSRGSFELGISDLTELVALHSELTVPAGPATLTGAIEMHDAMLEIIEPLEARIAGLDAKITGKVRPEAGFGGSDIVASLHGPALANLLAGFGFEVPLPDGPFALDMGLQVQPDRAAYRVPEFRGSLGDTSISGNALLVNSAGWRGSKLSLDASGSAFEDFASVAGIDVQPGAFELSGEVELAGDELRVRNLRLERARGQATLDLDLGLPASRRVASFELAAGGQDVGALMRGYAEVELEPAAYDVLVQGRVDADHWNFDQVKLGVGDARITARGDLNLAETDRSSRIEISGDIPNLAALGRWRDRHPLDQRLSWSASIAAGNGVLTADNIEVRLDESDIRGSLRYVRRDVPSLDARLESESIVIKPVLEPGSDEPEAIVQEDDERLIPDVKVPVELIRGLNGSLDVNVRELVRGDLHLRDVVVSATQQDGSLVVSRAGFKGPAGHIEAQARVDAVGENAAVSLRVLARDFALGLSPTNKDLANRNRVDLNIVASGADLRALAASTTGALLTDSRGGRSMGVPALERIYGDAISQLLNTINPFASGKQQTKLECAILPLAFDAGKITAAPAAFFSSDKVRMTVHPSINLATEKLDINIETAARKGLGLSAGEVLNPFVKVVGTLASPKLGVDEQGALIRGGAAVATGGLTILARMARDRLTRSRNPCDDTFVEASQLLADRLPTLSHVSLDQRAAGDAAAP